MVDEQQQQEHPPEKVGWIGLGNIGAPMAERLLDNPAGLVVCDVVAAATEPFAAKGAEVAADAAAVAAAGATVISVMVRTDDQVRDVVRAIAPVATPGTVVAIHSTIAAETAIEMAAEVADAGLHVVDAPVSGGFMGAATGRLAILIGGDEDVVDRCRRAFAPMADLVIRFGPVGAGTTAKVARNLITYASYVAVAEASRLAEAAGLDLIALGQVVRHSDAVTGGPGAVMVRRDMSLFAEDDGLRPSFLHGAELGEKDLALAVEMGDALGVDTPVAEQAQGLIKPAMGIDG
jgi:3-hydroxyisobutyrate dehydrogenase